MDRDMDVQTVHLGDVHVSGWGPGEGMYRPLRFTYMEGGVDTSISFTIDQARAVKKIVDSLIEKYEPKA